MIEKYMWSEVVDAYKGHEIASHSLTHPHLERLDRATCRAEMVTDMINIEALTGICRSEWRIRTGRTATGWLTS